MKHLVLVIALAAFSTSAFAEGSYQDAEELRWVRTVRVSIEDGVKDGCLSNPNALKVEAELILRRFGFSVSGNAQGPNLVIAAVGWELKQEGGQGLARCTVALKVKLWRFARVPGGHIAFITAYQHGALLADYTKAETQQVLRTTVSEIVSDIANEILKARGN